MFIGSKLFQSDQDIVNLVAGASKEQSLKSSYELEVRFGRHIPVTEYRNYNPDLDPKNESGLIFTSGVQRPRWAQFNSEMEKLISPDRIERKQITTYRFHGGYRQRVIEYSDGRKEEVWEKKTNRGHYECDKYWFRAALSEEEKLKYPPVDTSVTPYRQASVGPRITYQWDDITIIDVSHYNGVFIDSSTGEERPSENYEIEIEMLDPVKNRARVLNFMTNVYRIIQIYLKTNYLYTKSEFEKLNQVVTTLLTREARTDFIPRQVLSRARNAQISDFHIGKGGIIGGEVAYEMTHKTDGTRKMMVFGPYGVWLIYPPYEYIKISLSGADVLTILDVEVVILRDKDVPVSQNDIFSDLVYLIEPIDALIVKGEDIRQNLPNVNDRLDQARAFRDYLLKPEIYVDKLDPNLDLQRIPIYNDQGDMVEAFRPDEIVTVQEETERTKISRMALYRYPGKGSNFDIRFKPRKQIQSPDQFFALVDQFYQQIRPYTIDGLIFTPIHTPYLDDYKRHPQEIIKWKPLDDVSIDFFVEKSGAGYHLKYVLEDGSYAVFTGDKAGKYPFDAAKNLVTSSTYIKNLISDNVYEFKWDPIERVLWPFRERFEKSGPNDRATVMDNWRDMMNPITLNDLKGLTLFFFRKYHNSIKRGLFTAAPGKTLLDLGSGQAGDAEKWSKFDHIIAVEPNYDEDPQRFVEFYRRARIFGVADKITLIKAGGQDYSVIIPFVYQITGGRGVDVVSMMDSLTFFWESPEKLRQLVTTISSCLTSGGSFIWKVMDGDAVKNLLQPPFHGEVKTIQMFGPLGGQITQIELLQQTDQVRIYIPGFVENQIEYLTRLSDLYILLSEHGIVPRRRFNASDSTRFLQEDYLTFSKLYSYGEFVRQSPFTMTSSSPPDYSFRVLEHVTPTPKVIETPALTKQSMFTFSVPTASSSITPSPVPLPSIFTQKPTGLLPQPKPISVMLQAIQGNLPSTPEAPSDWTDVVMLPDDMTTRRILDGANDWCNHSDKIIRLSTIPDGHCLIHSFEAAVDPLYQKGVLAIEKFFSYDGRTYMPGQIITDARQARTLLAVRLRHDLSLNLKMTVDDPNNGMPGWLPVDKWEKFRNGQFLTGHFRQITLSADDLDAGLAPQKGGVGPYDFDYSLLGLYNLLNSSRDLPGEIFDIISKIVGIDILVINGQTNTKTGMTRSLAVQFYTRGFNNTAPFCIIMQVRNHFETIGLDVDGKIQTLFKFNPDGSSFYQRVRSFVSTKFDLADQIDNNLSLETIIFNAVDKVTDTMWYIMNYLTRNEPSVFQPNLYRVDFTLNPFVHHLCLQLTSDEMKNRHIKSDFYFAHIQMTLEAVKDYNNTQIIMQNAYYMARMLLGTDFTQHGQMVIDQIITELNTRLTQ